MNEKLKDKWIQVQTEAESKEVQEIAFKCGYVWWSGLARDVRSVSNTTEPIIYFDDDDTMLYENKNISLPEVDRITLDYMRSLVAEKTFKNAKKGDVWYSKDGIGGRKSMKFLVYQGSGMWCHQRAISSISGEDGWLILSYADKRKFKTYIGNILDGTVKVPETKEKEVKKTMKVEIELPVFDGYEFEALRSSFSGEYFLSAKGDGLRQAEYASDCLHFVYKKLEVWRDAQIPTKGNFRDYGKKARFLSGEEWLYGNIVGYSIAHCQWTIEGKDGGRLLGSSCQVLEAGE